MRAHALTLLAALALAGCADTREAARPTRTPTPTPTREPTAAPQPPHRALAFRASDGTRLRGRYTPAGRGAPAVVLVHEYNGEPAQFDPLVPLLHDAGFATLAYASRDPRELDEAVLARDVRGAVAAVRRLGARRVALVGSSIGATTVAYVLGTRPELRLRGAVGLSPVENGGLINAGSSGRFRPHDLLLIADDHEYTDVENIKLDAGGKGVTGFKARIGGHGVRMLPDRAVRDRLLGWLRERLAA